MIDLTNTWCYATEENYNALAELGVYYNNNWKDLISSPYFRKDDIFAINYNNYTRKIHWDNSDFIKSVCKQIHLVNGNFEYVKEGLRDYQMDKIREISSTKEQLTDEQANYIKDIKLKFWECLAEGVPDDVTSNDLVGLQTRKKECQFAKYGFKDIPYRRTKNGICTQIYSDQKKSCKRRGHQMPSYTSSELKDWMKSQTIFHELYNKWVINGYEKMLKPSIDRIDDSLSYSFDNIQITTWGENKSKGHKDIRSGKLKHGNKPQTPVIQYTKKGNFVAIYVSQAQANRQTGISQGHIGNVCRRERKSAGGYFWRYATKEEVLKLVIGE